MEKSREDYDRRLIEMMACKPEPLADRISVAFECFVELALKDQFPDLCQQFHALLKIEHDLLRIQREAHFLRNYRPDGQSLNAG
jgi:hypothetical protein